MQFDDFRESLKSKQLPEGLSVYLQSLWYDGSGNWQKAHQLVDTLEDKTACWVHAYLHRREGDTWNADYWYRRAQKKRPDILLDKEWELIVKALL